jgi:hypothetical protein
VRRNQIDCLQFEQWSFHGVKLPLEFLDLGPESPDFPFVSVSLVSATIPMYLRMIE